MKGKKFIAIISIVCILAVILCIPAFATVTESDGDGYALYNGVKLLNIDSVWNDKVSYPYAFVSGSAEDYAILVLLQQPVSYDGSHYVSNIGFSISVYLYTLNQEIASILNIEVGVWNLESSGVLDNTYIIDVVGWTSHDIINTTDNSIYLAASTPISLNGYNLIEWDGDTAGLEYFDTLSSYALTTGRIDAVDAFAVMNLSYSQQPVVIDGFVSLEDIGWYVEPPTSSYMFSCSNALVEPAASSESYYATVALKFDDVDDTGYTSLIAYRSVEEPPEEGGDEPDDPQPPFGAIEI